MCLKVKLYFEKSLHLISIILTQIINSVGRMIEMTLALNETKWLSDIILELICKCWLHNLPNIEARAAKGS